MTFKKNLLVAVMAVLLLASCQQKEAAKVAVLDPGQVFQTCDVCLEGGNYLRGLSDKMRVELTEMQASMQTDTSEDAPKKFQERYAALQAEMQEEQNRIAGMLNETFVKIMNEYRAKNNVGVIMNKENVLSFDEADDITEAMIAAMNGANIDLALPEKAEAAPAAEEKKSE
ncbi:OmpH family outer membrane protein [Desulfovibrio ferrophilus]|uniref:Outer membrane chaperone Skp OmpH n=1 Tax=Desulfovibrio ferrophilus TaxID=241368 RepID=A0A2Z6AV25_9BACT|nr:OmpH family outer membrane protein [Desulfovibrio ferrophilus]BBD07036.1 outer membrane chaperone Skp OmpH [Desulfovibrio ferrophilus]